MMMQSPNIPSSGPIDLPLDGSVHSLWMPVNAAQGAADIDFAFYFILAICTFFFVLIVGLGILFVVKYRKRPGYVPKPSPHHSLKLEITWSVIPIILCVFMFWFGFTSYMHGRTMPAKAEQISVVAAKWRWEFQYGSPNRVSPELHVPVNEPVVMTMRSLDVIHSFFIPAFRTKLDVVPGRYSKVWFTPTKEGEYQLFCTEYCGTGHSGMAARVIVQSREDYEAWVAGLDVKDSDFPTAWQWGEYLFTKKGCAVCHHVDGTKLVGPPLNLAFGNERKFADGTSLVADENYIRESILVPGAKVVEGYPNAMTPYQGLVNDSELDGLIAYIKHLAGKP
ncbi:MAG: cytochrome c oxidase subunit II [Planctomycetes bacterium]|nr:cytochrome c oxidase subunit II [Planctomycetota bacterium]MCB9910576.1 cytochrome c oxidase subunit II [Planctomycetota bacterium]MCB9913209.1 cytochrome c oxidase subunit II [Planctomycetota bacterium]HRV82622.1 cytochrome c oxidase subunit II [Planctomycetota bacterium]